MKGTFICPYLVDRKHKNMHNENMPIRNLLPVAGLLFFLSATVFATENSDTQSLASRFEELNRTTARLVEDARSSQAKASDFRIAVTLYRESLRSLMLDDRENKNETARIPQNMLINMVRMSALLSSAAGCKTGRYIVCPIELMTQLSSQQRILAQDLESFRADRKSNT